MLPNFFIQMQSHPERRGRRVGSDLLIDGLWSHRRAAMREPPTHVPLGLRRIERQISDRFRSKSCLNPNGLVKYPYLDNMGSSGFWIHLP